MQVKAGKYYLRRDGKIAGPISKTPKEHCDEEFRRWCPRYQLAYNDSGEWVAGAEHSRDLIAECDKDGNPIKPSAEPAPSSGKTIDDLVAWLKEQRQVYRHREREARDQGDDYCEGQTGGAANMCGHALRWIGQNLRSDPSDQVEPKATSTEIKPGTWWECVDGDRYYCVGFNTDGDPVLQNDRGNYFAMDDQRSWCVNIGQGPMTLLPECSGWGWTLEPTKETP